MSKKTAILFVLLFGLFFSVQAQDKKKDRKAARVEKKAAKVEQNDDAGDNFSDPGATPKNMVEVGLNPGHAFVSGDVSFKPGYGVGLHIRKATDYLFSLRADVLYAKTKGENVSGGTITRQFDGEWISFTGFGILSLNSARWDRKVRRFNYFVMLGGGGNMTKANFTNELQRKGVLDNQFSAHVSGGAGIAFRVNSKINIGLEHQVMMLLGSRADLLDGKQGSIDNRTDFRDILNFSSISININIGQSSGASEPLYWLNPMEKVMADVAGVKARQDGLTTDSDGDGVLDAVDQEPNTPREATVDTKGRTLDSDRDGVPDYKDKEPYYTPRPGEVANALGVVENPIAGGRGGVTENRVKELIDEAISGLRSDPNLTAGNNNFGTPGANGGTTGNTAAAAVTEWFLPMVHFGSDSKTIKYSDYGTLASIARMMKSNSSFKLVVTGHSDQTAPENYNNNLSYSRAKSVVDHLVNNHGIGRGRIILQWKGEKEALVPFTSSYMNRRVEFRVARPNDVEMDPPTSQKTSGF